MARPYVMWYSYTSCQVYTMSVLWLLSNPEYCRFVKVLFFTEPKRMVAKPVQFGSCHLGFHELLDGSPHMSRKRGWRGIMTQIYLGTIAIKIENLS